jgi:hypothetical protein
MARLCPGGPDLLTRPRHHCLREEEEEEEEEEKEEEEMYLRLHRRGRRALLIQKRDIKAKEVKTTGRRRAVVTQERDTKERSRIGGVTTTDITGSRSNAEIGHLQTAQRAKAAKEEAAGAGAGAEAGRGARAGAGTETVAVLGRHQTTTTDTDAV